MFYTRKIWPLLLYHLSKKQITLITGLRRTGKTTLAKQLLKECNSINILYLDLERIDNRLLFSEKNYDNIILAFKSRGLKLSEKAFIAIDEIQLMPEITSSIKYLYDNYDIKFILTGSSSFYLKGNVSDSLAGRKKIFELFPLDFKEYLDFQEVPNAGTGIHSEFIISEYERLKNFYQEFLTFGGLPEVALSKNDSHKKDIISDIISSYINIDIKSISDFKSLSMINKLITMLAARSGSRLDITKLSNLTAISRPTIMNYLDLFEKTYLIHLLPVFSLNADREIVKAKKVYFCDTGILNYFSNIGSGAIFENAVFLQLKQYDEIKYYSLKSGKEIDFIINNIAYEAKETPAVNDLESVKIISKPLGIKQSFIVGKHPPAKMFNDFVWAGNIL